MILKGLKRNAIKKSIEASLDKRNASSQHISNLKTLAVLIDASYSVNILSLVKLANELGVSPNNLKIMGYKEDKEVEDDKDAAYYNDKSFGVNGAIKSRSLQEFVGKDYDVLISFYGEDKIELNYVAAASNAKLKVGFANVDNRINDLIIGATVNNPNLFIKELKKYLKILQVI
ncbi:hypothetical protein U6A24_08780 [Aquimarina gracilis]|uniref:Uncharacterized protein n=1 Tax=Aquimarina gracilis TaxID=874422 RepID=A0ABU5ZTZ5_9FLAO|nr:hypothetical protein [Aquimarina gracilis]MEB3345551.1 hypothetical protein [Aquimarina gracilis]